MVSSQGCVFVIKKKFKEEKMKFDFADEGIKSVYNQVTDPTVPEKTYEIIYGFDCLYELKNQIDLLKATRHFSEYLKSGWTTVTSCYDKKDKYEIQLTGDDWLIVSIIPNEKEEDTVCLERMSNKC